VAGLGAARMAASHYSVMTKETSALFVAGPPVVNALINDPAKHLDRFRLGGWEIQTRCGAVDQAVDSEEEAFACTRRFLSYLPSSVFEVKPRGPRQTPRAARGIPVRGDPARPAQGLQDAPDRRAVDGPGSFFEMGRLFGRIMPALPGRRAAIAVMARASVLYGAWTAVLRQDHPLCRPRRDLSPPDHLSVRLPRLSYRAGGRKARRSGRACARWRRSANRPCRGARF
jgi:hypothetical protein